MKNNDGFKNNYYNTPTLRDTILPAQTLRPGSNGDIENYLNKNKGVTVGQYGDYRANQLTNNLRNTMDNNPNSVYRFFNNEKHEEGYKIPPHDDEYYNTVPEYPNNGFLNHHGYKGLTPTSAYLDNERKSRAKHIMKGYDSGADQARQMHAFKGNKQINRGNTQIGSPYISTTTDPLHFLNHNLAPYTGFHDAKKTDPNMVPDVLQQSPALGRFTPYNEEHRKDLFHSFTGPFNKMEVDNVSLQSRGCSR